MTDCYPKIVVVLAALAVISFILWIAGFSPNPPHVGVVETKEKVTGRFMPPLDPDFICLVPLPDAWIIRKINFRHDGKIIRTSWEVTKEEWDFIYVGDTVTNR